MDLDLTLEVVGDVREIDVETLPDGSPRVVGTLVTPDSNYANRGVPLVSSDAQLSISEHAETGFNLGERMVESGGPRNWIIAESEVTWYGSQCLVWRIRANTAAEGAKLALYAERFEVED